ncbi:MAG: hypothetical protein GPJ54_14315 [Candidatus Heimdallarchaeota archaeon]|nr:hypothetical protein [Candidatus Heimdallarchaeota archaeon]
MSRALMITFYSIIIIGLLLLIPFLIIFAGAIFFAIIGPDNPRHPEYDDTNAYLHEEFTLVVRFSDKTNFSLLHPVIYSDGEIIEVMTQVSMLTRLEGDEYILSTIKTMNNTDYLLIDGYADEFYIQNFIEHPLKTGRISYENYLFSLEIGTYKSDAYFYLIADDAEIFSFYSNYHATTNFCGVHKEVYHETGLDGFEFTEGWDNYPSWIGASCQ